MIRQKLLGIAALAGILTILVGLPLVLLQVGYPTPPAVHSWHDLYQLLLRQDDGTLALVVLKSIGWVTWAFMAGLTTLEIVARARRVPTRELPGLRLPQTAIRQLVAAAAALFVAAPTTNLLTHTPPPPAVVTQTAQPTAAKTAVRIDTPPTPQPPSPATRTHVVKRGETLWSIAETQLGDGRRYTEIAALNPQQLSGQTDTFLTPGWTLQIPQTPNQPEPLVASEQPNRPDQTNEPDEPTEVAAEPEENAGAEQHAEAEAEVEPEPITYRVQRGDTLSKIALRFYGDPDAYPRIFEASKHTRQPGGYRLTNPDQIDIGWTLTIPPQPTTKTTAAPKQKTTNTPANNKTPTNNKTLKPTPTPTTTVDTTANPATTAPVSPAVVPSPDAPAVPVAPSVAATPVVVPQAGVAAGFTGDHRPTLLESNTLQMGEPVTVPGWVCPGLVGAGSILAGSMWMALRQRRNTQLRWRRPGRMIATPPPELDPIDQTLRTEGAAWSLDVGFIDQTLRRLATNLGSNHQPMPNLAALEISDTHLRLHLAEPAHLPEPWEPAPDPLRWQIPTTTDLDQLGPNNPALPAPYPQLVTLGIDQDGHRWLYNLEQAGTIAITGDPTRARDYTRHLTAELAVHPWTTDLTIELAGIAHQAVPLNPRRVHHHKNPGDITARTIAEAITMIERTTQAGLDIPTGRATLLEDPLWDSRTLILDTQPDEPAQQLANLLNNHPNQTGTTLITINTDDNQPGWDTQQIHITKEGRLQLPDVGLHLTAAGLTEQETAGCALIFTHAQQPDVPYPDHPNPEPGWQTHTNQAGQLHAGHTIPRNQHPTQPTHNLLPEPDPTYLQTAATTSQDLAALAPHVPDAISQQVQQDDPTLDDDLATWNDPNSPLPKLMLLGPLTVRVAATGTPTAAVGRKPYLSELLAYLATRPHGATTEEVADAMRINPDRVRKDIHTLRTWLGTNPKTGRPHIPDSRQTKAAKTRGQPAYQIEDLQIDADLFRRLRTRAQTRGPAGIQDLKQALTLVKGTPFSQLRRDGGAWLAQGNRLDQILQCAIIDVAHTITTAALAQGDHTTAQQTAELAATIAPAEETPQLDLAAALTAQGHHQTAQQLLRNQIHNRSDEEDQIPTELPPRTQTILDTQTWNTRNKRKASA